MIDLNKLFHEQFKTLPNLESFIDWIEYLFISTNIDYSYYQKLNLIFSYKNLLRQPLTINMFIPISSNNILRKPYCIKMGYDEWDENGREYDEVTIYREAQKKIIFPGYEFEEECENYIMFKDTCDVWDKHNNSLVQEHLNLICGEPKSKLSDMVGRKISKNFKIV